MKPYAAEAMYEYKALNQHELSVSAGQLLQVAPREVQQTHKLLNTGWALATIDNQTSGLIPINYVRRVESKPVHHQPVIIPEAPIFDVNGQKDVPNETSEFSLNKTPIDSSEMIFSGGQHAEPMLPTDINADL